MSRHFAIIYILLWGFLCTIALFFTWINRKKCALFWREYWAFLLRPWKITTFMLATLGLIFSAPYMNDDTWDFWTSSFMGILTFLTAPWSVGVLYRFTIGRERFYMTFVATCLMLFSASWSYDLYLFLRDGEYTSLWLVNLAASSMLYLMGGLLWNLCWIEGKGVIYAFTEPEWPAAVHGVPLRKVFWKALAIMLAVCAAMIPFVYAAAKMFHL